MRRYTIPILLLVFALLLTACGGKEESEDPNSLLNVLEWTDDAVPTACRIYLDGRGMSEVCVTDAEAVSALWSSLKSVTVGEKSEIRTTDAYHYAEFLFEDNRSLALMFEDKLLDMGEDAFELNGTEDFWKQMETLAAQAEEPAEE